MSTIPDYRSKTIGNDLEGLSIAKTRRRSLTSQPYQERWSLCTIQAVQIIIRSKLRYTVQGFPTHKRWKKIQNEMDCNHISSCHDLKCLLFTLVLNLLSILDYSRYDINSTTQQSMRCINMVFALPSSRSSSQGYHMLSQVAIHIDWSLNTNPSSMVAYVDLSIYETCSTRTLSVQQWEYMIEHVPERSPPDHSSVLPITIRRSCTLTTLLPLLEHHEGCLVLIADCCFDLRVQLCSRSCCLNHQLTIVNTTESTRNSTTPPCAWPAGYHLQLEVLHGVSATTGRKTMRLTSRQRSVPATTTSNATLAVINGISVKIVLLYVLIGAYGQILHILIFGKDGLQCNSAGWHIGGDEVNHPFPWFFRPQLTIVS